MHGELPQRIEPELPIMDGEPPRQECGDRVNIGLVDLTAAQACHGEIIRVDHEHFMNLIVSVAGIYRAGVNKR